MDVAASASGPGSPLLPRIAVYGSDPRRVDEVARAAREALGWIVIPTGAAGDEALEATRNPLVTAHLLVGEPSEPLAHALSIRPPSVPLVVLGGTPRREPATSCWLPSIPTPSLLASILVNLVGASPQAARKRKSDLIVGRSPAIEELLRTLDRIASATAPVLVTGESGTGKELVARALHYSSTRAAAPFIAINCAAIPAALFESELFGHVRGAFTGASTSRPGVFESADGGTLFLDEIGDLPLPMQVKLLRVLETGEVTRLGATEVRRTQVRIVAATNRSLEDEVLASRFREDLYYRIRVLHVRIPPLRERIEDVPPLVSHCLAAIAARDGRPVPMVTRAAIEKLLRHRWPGNVRELVNCLERAVVLAAPAAGLDAADIFLPDDAPPLLHDYRVERDRFERSYHEQLLRTSGGNVSLAAKLAKRTRAQVYEAMRRLGLDPSGFRVDEEPQDN